MARFSSNDTSERNVSDEDSRLRPERLLFDANNAASLQHKLALIDIEAAHRLAWHRSHFNPDQPRVPAGHPDGGQWTSEGGVQPLDAVSPLRAQDRLIMSDAAPDGIRVWTQYAEAKDREEVQNKGDADADLIERTTAILHNAVLQVSGIVIRRPGSTPREFGINVHFAFATEGGRASCNDKSWT
jgi:hypothetical protein